VEFALLSGLSAAVAWLGSLEARRGSITITVENLAAALIALTVTVEVLHVWGLGEIGFTLAFIAVQFAAGLLLSRSVLLWPILMGSSAAWFMVVIQQQPLMRWMPFTIAVVLTCRWSIRVANRRVAEALSLSDGEQLNLEQHRQKLLEQMDCEAQRDRERQAIRSAGDGHWYWDLVKDKCYFSDGWPELLGFEADDIGDSPDEFFNRIHAHYLPQVKEDLSAHIYGKLPRLQCQFRM
jgi:PAS domain-containing protein